jgi:N-methylhydantoinase B
MSEIDPITLSVLAGRMEQIADEMDATLFRAAFNPIIAEAHDASHGLYHAVNGDTLVQGKSGLPIFVGVMSFAGRWGPRRRGYLYLQRCPYRWHAPK